VGSARAVRDESPPGRTSFRQALHDGHARTPRGGPDPERRGGSLLRPSQVWAVSDVRVAQCRLLTQMLDRTTGTSPMSTLPPRQSLHAHILILEDDRDLRRVLVELLTGEGFEVSTCDSYSALLQAVDEYGAPIVLADFWGTSHTELSPRERDELRDLGRQAPTILLTGRAWIANVNANDLNVICILPKPIDLDDILEQIHRCLQVATDRIDAAAGP
jgi:ActR/RegA family two-component response regulator